MTTRASLPLVEILILLLLYLIYFLNPATADFDVGTLQIVFPVGVSTVCFNVPILEDDITEDNEIFEISATPSVGGSPTIISVCIRDNDSKIYY